MLLSVIGIPRTDCDH